MSSEEEPNSTDSEQEYKPLKFKSNLASKKTRRRTVEPLIDGFSFALGAFLAAPFMVLLCASEDMLSGSKKATGLVFIAASAPSCAVKMFFLIFQSLSNTSYVSRAMMMFMLVVSGLICVAMSQTSYNVRYVGVCFASLGMAIGEVYMLSLTSKNLKKTALTSFIAGTGAGGLISTLCYIAMTCWSDVNPRAALLVPLVWPTIFLLTFAVFHMECLKSNPDLDRFTKSVQETPKTSCAMQLVGVWKALDILSLVFVSNFSLFVSLGAITTTLVFNHAEAMSSREDFQHYILSSVIGQFFGRAIMALLLAKIPDVRATPFQAVGVLFSAGFMLLLFFASWNRFVHSIWGIFTVCVLQGMASGVLSIVSYHQLSRDAKPRHIELLLITSSLFESFGMLCAGLIGLHTEPSLFQRCYEISYADSSQCLTRVMNASFWLEGKSPI